MNIPQLTGGRIAQVQFAEHVRQCALDLYPELSEIVAGKEQKTAAWWINHRKSLSNIAAGCKKKSTKTEKSNGDVTVQQQNLSGMQPGGKDTDKKRTQSEID